MTANRDYGTVDDPETNPGAFVGAYTVEDLAKLGYTAYGERTGWRNHRGEPMPSWTELPDPQRAPYYVMASAIGRAARTDLPTS